MSPDADLGTVFGIQNCIIRHKVIRRDFATRQHHRIALSIDQPYRRSEVFRSAWAIFRIKHGNVAKTREFVGLAIHRQTFFHFMELNNTSHFRHDRDELKDPTAQ